MSMSKKLDKKFKKTFSLVPFDMNIIDVTAKSIKKDKYPEVGIMSEDIEFVIKCLIEYIEEFGSYWKRNVPPLNKLYKREEFILSILNFYFEQCGIEWKHKEPPLNVLNRRFNIIKHHKNKKIDECNIKLNS